MRFISVPLAFSLLALACSGNDASPPGSLHAVDGGTDAKPDSGIHPKTDAGAESATNPPASPDALSPEPVDAGKLEPSFASWAWSKPDVKAVVHAGFDWFESGYPGTLSASDNQFLTDNGTLPLAYINMGQVPNDDSNLQEQIGSWWTEIKLCQDSGWNVSIVDVRDSRWQKWLIDRVNAAYSLGNRGIKWDVAGVENLCDGWAAYGGATAAQEAVDAMANVLIELRKQHPDIKFLVNQGFELAKQHPELIDGLEWENMLNFCSQTPGQWCDDEIAKVDQLRAKGIRIFDLEYIDLFGCSDTTCETANQLYDQAVAHDWSPYITTVHMDIEGRGLGIVPPW